MVHPDTGNAPLPNPDMPSEVLEYYREAASIAQKSPRAAAALLRLSLQHLCIALGEKGKNINDDIGALVAKGLSPLVQQSLDVVRVTGNNAVHPGQIDVDDPAVVASLFALLNVVVEYMISMPKQVQKAYAGLPPNILQAIQQRDTP